MIRDVTAAVIAALLFFLAMKLATTLKYYRGRRQRARDAEQALGRTVIVEIPGEDDLVLVTEDAGSFYYGARAIEKARITAVRVLINGATIASAVSSAHAARFPADHAATAAPVIDDPDQHEGILRDRWDVVIDATDGTTVVACGAIRERVSQELARAVFDAVKRDLEGRDRTAGAGPLTTPSRERRRDD